MNVPVEFSRDDCKTVIGHRDLDSFEFNPWSSRIMGYLGVHLRLNVKLTNGQNQQYFVKTLPYLNVEHRKNVVDLRVIEKEGKIYDLILNALPDTILDVKWKPKCYFHRDDILVLEDLTHLGFSLTPDRFVYTDAHVKSVLRSLAILHASSVHFEQNILKDKIKHHPCVEIFFETTTSSDCDWFIAGLKALQGIALKYFPCHETFIREHFWEELCKVFALIEDSVNMFPCVVTHRDMWAKNVMFKGLDCVLLDFQIARYLPQAYDISMCLYLHLRKRERRKVYDECLTVYYEQYVRVLHVFGIEENVSSLEELRESCKYFELLGLVIKGVTTQITHLPEGFMGDLIQDPEEYKKFENIDRTEKLLEVLEQDEYYKAWMIESVEELLEYTMNAKKC